MLEFKDIDEIELQYEKLKSIVGFMLEEYVV